MQMPLETFFINHNYLNSISQDEILYQVDANPQNWMVAGRKSGHISFSEAQGQDLKKDTSVVQSIFIQHQFTIIVCTNITVGIHFTHRIKDRDRRDMCPAGVGVRTPATARPARRRRCEYQLQSGRSPPGVRASSHSQHLLLHTGLIHEPSLCHYVSYLWRPPFEIQGVLFLPGDYSFFYRLHTWCILIDWVRIRILVMSNEFFFFFLHELGGLTTELGRLELIS